MLTIFPQMWLAALLSSADIGACESIMKKKTKQDFQELLKTEHSKSNSSLVWSIGYSREGKIPASHWPYRREFCNWVLPPRMPLFAPISFTGDPHRRGLVFSDTEKLQHMESEWLSSPASKE